MFRWKAIKGSPLDTFFKNVTSNETPSCRVANEYLAEDRIMCLQVYIKETTGYTVTYIPDAKAFTDGPPTMTVLMKQRRRWMNGALFGTASVIANFTNMISCGRNDHPWYRQAMMILFMIYMVTLYFLQFFTMGAMFASIIIFFDQFFVDIFVSNGSEWMTEFYDSGVPKEVFFSVYIFCLFLSIFIAISLPIDRAMPYFRVVAVIFAIIVLTSIVGICYFLAKSGFYPPERKFNAGDNTWTDTGNYYFSWLELAGVIMLAVYLLPFILRPVDFFQNAGKYCLGLLSYLFLLPMFANVF